MGADAARRAAEAALARGPLGAALIVGLCGFLAPELRTGEPAIYESIRSNGSVLQPDRELRDLLGAALPGATRVRAVQSAGIVWSSSVKASLARAASAQAVDMESFTLIDCLRRAGVRVAVVRVGSDAAGDDLPDLSAAFDAQGQLRPPELTRAMLRRPAAALRLVRNGLRALASLERSVEQICRYPEAGPAKP